MQFHLNGLKGSQDPLQLLYEGETQPDFQSSLPSEVDVLIVGAGPAGLLLATQLSRFPNITTRIIESKNGRLEQGQADGLQCRTIEIFEAFGFSERVLKEAYWVNETTFWSPGPNGELIRTGRIRDTEEGLSEFPHVILNQARMHDMWLDAMKGSVTRLEPSYNRRLSSIDIPPVDGPVNVTIERIDTGKAEHIRAKYVVGCDGARSGVRTALGLELRGDFSNVAWGVIDALVVTDFPDVRLKTAIHSASEGSILIIPREGGYLARFYIELEKLKAGDRLDRKSVTAETLIERAQLIFKPFKFEVRHVAYFNVYEVGQRLTDHFDDVPKAEREERSPRVFIAGDACHTHSAKAGQGMNVSMNDSYNLGWKLGMVLNGTADTGLLHTYNDERHDIAKLLIDFDREISKQFAAKPKSKGGEDDLDAIDPAVFQDYFTRQGRFMAGVETTYKPGMLTLEDKGSHQSLAKGFQIGTRFHSVQVLRLADARPRQLGHYFEADGRWRIVLFGDKQDPTSHDSPLWKTCDFLSNTLIPRYTPAGADVDSIFDVRCVLQQPRKDVSIMSLPPLLLPHKGKFGIQDYEKVFTDEASYGFGHGEIFEARSVSRDSGCLLLVRPDQYISAVLPLGQGSHDAIGEFFGGFLKAQKMVAGSNGTNGHI